jgi:glyoxylase-like metal-dependent hydrolase (beta-lactamase superfamily II)
MPGFADHARGLQEDPSGLEEMVRVNERHLSAEVDERRLVSLELSIARLNHRLEMLPTLELWLPNQTFDGKLIFHGKHRSVELLTRGKGHTSSDCFLILPEEKIAFMGDLAFFQCQPFMVNCDPEAWIAQIEEMVQADIDAFVPGHGPLGGKEDPTLQNQYIIVMEELVTQVVNGNGSVEDALRQALPAPYDTWLIGGMARFEANVRSSYERHVGE